MIHPYEQHKKELWELRLIALAAILVAAVCFLLLIADKTSNIPLFSSIKADGIAVYDTFLRRDKE